jgi:hypothetical protein
MIRLASTAFIVSLAFGAAADAQTYTPNYPQGQTASQQQTQNLQLQQQQQTQQLQQQQMQTQQNNLQAQAAQRQQQVNAQSAPAQGRPAYAQTYVTPSRAPTR